MKLLKSLRKNHRLTLLLAQHHRPLSLGHLDQVDALALRVIVVEVAIGARGRACDQVRVVAVDHLEPVGLADTVGELGRLGVEIPTPVVGSLVVA